MPACLGLGKMPTGAALAFAACLSMMPWPWQCFLAIVALLMDTALNLVV